MAARSKRTSASTTFRWQRFHPALQPGDRLTVAAKREAPMPVHFSQSDLDGACGVHCVASVLVILGLAKSHALTLSSRRKYGVPADLWRAFADCWFSGCSPLDLADRLDGTELPLQTEVVTADMGDVERFAVSELSRGELVMVGFTSVLNRLTNHWALGVGSEGVQTGQRAVVDSLLLLDPGESEPVFRCFNARMRHLDGAERRKLARRVSLNRTASYWWYEAPASGGEPVRLDSAVRIRRA